MNYYNGFGKWLEEELECVNDMFQSSHRPSHQDPEILDGFDEVGGISRRLKRQIEVWNVLGKHNLAELRWDVVGYDYELMDRPNKAMRQAIQQRRSEPPPPEDPRT